MTVAFALDALVDVTTPTDPGVAIADALRERGIAVSDDWPETYRETTLDAPDGAAVPRQARVSAALRRAGVDPASGEGNAVRRAVVAALDPAVETKPGATAAVAAAADRGAVGVLANTTVPDLARRALVRSAVDRDRLDAVVTAAGCGWRPPHPNAFETLAGRLDVACTDLTFVGDDEGVAAVGGTPVVIGSEDRGEADAEVVTLPSLRAVPAWLDAGER